MTVVKTNTNQVIDRRIITAPVTIAAPTASPIQEGVKLIYKLIQNETGGFNVDFDSVFVGAPTPYNDPALNVRTVTFVSDGAGNFNYESDTLSTTDLEPDYLALFNYRHSFNDEAKNFFVPYDQATNGAEPRQMGEDATVIGLGIPSFYAQVAHQANFTRLNQTIPDELTISFWSFGSARVRLIAQASQYVSSNSSQVVANLNPGYNSASWFSSFNSPSGYGSYYQYGGGSALSTTTNLPHHVCFVREDIGGGNFSKSLYLDGALFLNTASQPLRTTLNQPMFNVRCELNDYSDMTDVRIQPRALSSGDVLALYNATKDKYLYIPTAANDPALIDHFTYNDTTASEKGYFNDVVIPSQVAIQDVGSNERGLKCTSTSTFDRTVNADAATANISMIEQPYSLSFWCEGKPTVHLRSPETMSMGDKFAGFRVNIFNATEKLSWSSYVRSQSGSYSSSITTIASDSHSTAVIPGLHTGLHHICITKSGATTGEKIIYVDGSPVLTVPTATHALTSANAPLSTFYNQLRIFLAGNGVVDGGDEIDDVRLIRRVLHPQEVTNLYNEGVPRYL